MSRGDDERFTRRTTHAAFYHGARSGPLFLPGYLIPRACSRKPTTTPCGAPSCRGARTGSVSSVLFSPTNTPERSRDPNSSDGLLLTHRNKRFLSSLLGVADAARHATVPYSGPARQRVGGPSFDPARPGPSFVFGSGSSSFFRAFWSSGNSASGSASKAILVSDAWLSCFFPCSGISRVYHRCFRRRGGGGSGPSRPSRRAAESSVWWRAPVGCQNG